MKKLLVALFVVLVALFSYESFARSVHPDTFKKEAVTIRQVDVIHNLMPVIGPEGRKPYAILEVDVMSGGCTKAEDFEVNVVRRSGTEVVSIDRITPDLCEATPHVVTVQLRTENISGGTLHVANPLLVQTQVVH